MVDAVALRACACVCAGALQQKLSEQTTQQQGAVATLNERLTTLQQQLRQEQERATQLQSQVPRVYHFSSNTLIALCFFNLRTFVCLCARRAGAFTSRRGSHGTQRQRRASAALSTAKNDVSLVRANIFLMSDF